MEKKGIRAVGYRRVSAREQVEGLCWVFAHLFEFLANGGARSLKTRYHAGKS